MLRFSEEILLLILDNEEGDIAPSLSSHTLNVVLSGAVLMDLALENRVDSDSVNLKIIDSSPLGDDLLDPVLTDIAQEARAGNLTISHCLERTAVHGDEIRRKAFSSLVDRGILNTDGSDLYFLARKILFSRRYPKAEGEAVEEVQSRMMKLLFSDDIPGPRDIVIVALAASCDLFKCLLSSEDLELARERIELISKMDFIGQAVARSIGQIDPPAPPPTLRSSHEIPQVSGPPIIGNAFALAGDLNKFFVAQYRKHGPVFQFRVFNSQYFVLAGPEANRFVQKEGRRYFRSYETWLDFGHAMGAKNFLVNMDGPAHVRMRKVQGRAFSGPFIEDRIENVVDITRKMIAEWPGKQPIAVKKAMQRIIAEQIGILTTGVSPSEYIDDLTETLNGLLRVHVMRQMPSWTLRLPRFQRSKKRLEELYSKVWDHHRNEDSKDRNLISDLFELQENDPQFFSEADMKFAFLGPYFAGLDTAASTSAFMLYSIMNRPDLRERITAEADTFLEGETLTAKGLTELDVTRRILFETMRMYPAVPAIKRTVSNSFDFAGYMVPAGSRVLVANTLPHTLPEIFPDPDRFDIERFLPERAEHRQPGAFAPFGLGAHRCLGSNFAEIQIALTLLTIVREFELALDPPDYEVKIKRIPLPHPDSSFKVRVLRRRSNVSSQQHRQAATRQLSH